MMKFLSYFFASVFFFAAAYAIFNTVYLITFYLSYAN